MEYVMIVDIDLTAACATAQTAPWLAVTPRDGTLAANALQTIGVSASAGVLAAGTYRTQLCIDSNDATRPRLRVPLRFDINGDAIFRSRFEPQ